MSDIVSPEIRSRMMAGIKGKNTRPEMILRQGLHRLGFRYRLHDRRLPGTPDLVFPRYRAVIFARVRQSVDAQTATSPSGTRDAAVVDNFVWCLHF
jgi:DNA mismatch endonuclease Vsr